MISDSGNRRLLTDWLASHEFYEAVEPRGSITGTEFDLCILDEGALREHVNELETRKRETSPVLLPYLLLLSETSAGLVGMEGGRITDGVLSETIDEVITLPIEQAELQWRMKTLLRLRNQSLALKAREREIRESEELHRVTLNNITDTVLITDDDGRFTHVCSNVNNIFGYTADEVREMDTIDALIGDDLVDPERLADEGVIENIEHVVSDAQGSEHSVLVTVKGVSIAGGTRLYSIRDITQRKRQEERFKAFVEHSSDVIAVVDRDGVIEYVSPSIERVLGYDPDELIGEDAFELVHPDERDDARAAYRELLDMREESVIRLDYRTRHADGSWRWTESIATARTYSSADGLVINTRDITDRVERERELERIQESRSYALRAANTGVWEWDIETDEVTWHESCERVFGIDPGTFEGTYEAFARRVHPDDLPDIEEAIERARKRDGHFRVVFRITRDDGGKRWIDGRGRQITDESGRPIRMFGVAIDITERQERIQQLRVLDRVLRHNLHNEMNVIRGYAQLIEDDVSGAPAGKARDIVRWSDRLLDSVDKERKITDVLANEAVHDTMDLVSVVEGLSGRMRRDHPDADITLDLPEEAMVSATENIDEAVEELVRNAIVHSDDEPPEVDVSITVERDVVRLRVADNGPGIPEMERRVVTGEAEISPLYHGSGLGLWLISWIVRRSEGTLTFEENDPRGSVVTVELDRPSP